MRGVRLCIWCGIVALLVAYLGLLRFVAISPAQPAQAGKLVSFLDEVAPILKENCIACHDAKLRKGRLDMTTFDGLLTGGDRGPSVVAGKPEESPLYLLITGQKEPVMPPRETGGSLTKEQIGIIERWIREGAKFDGPSPKANLLVELRKRWNPPLPPAQYRFPAVIRALAFTPDGKHLLVGGYFEILVWDWENGQLVKRIRTRAERTNALAFLPDGKTLVVAGGRPGQEGDVRVYDFSAKPTRQDGAIDYLDGVDPKAGVLLRELVQTDDEMLALAVSKDGKRVAAGGCDRIVRVWDTEKWALEQSIENHADWVLDLCFTPDGKYLLSASRDKTAKVWDLSAKEPLATFPGHQEYVSGITVHPSGKIGISCGRDRQIRFWNIASNPNQIRTAGGHADFVEKVRLHPTKPILVSCSVDRTVRLWNADSGAQLRNLEGHTDAVFAIAISPDGQRIASGAWNGEVRLWSVDDGKLLRQFIASPLAPTAKK
ncbi:MAG: c-type cytochrome domain-containing protein [Gemmatales bacterium]|nr:hypothetical protein [Gemmatales bacterium]MDW7995439.1 c-type cytochrome domain-containing protein [Gemmatales bacterium]